MPAYTAAPPAAPVTASPASSDAAAAAEGVHEPPLPATNAVPAAMPVTAGAVLGPAAAAAAGRGPAKAEAVAAPVHVEVARTQGERGLLPAEGHQQVSMSNQAGVPGAPSHAPAGAQSACLQAHHESADCNVRHMKQIYCSCVKHIGHPDCLLWSCGLLVLLSCIHCLSCSIRRSTASGHTGCASRTFHASIHCCASSCSGDNSPCKL